jgi:hypothetical protein
MFKKRKAHEREVTEVAASLDDLRTRHAVLKAQVTSASSQTETACVELQRYFEAGDLANEKLRAHLEAAALAADGRAAPLKRALEALALRIVEAEQRLADTREQVEREKLFGEAERLNGQAIAALPGYGDHARALLDLFELVARANAAVAAANERLPPGVEPILPAEMVLRGLPSDERKILSEKPIPKWHYAGEDTSRGEVDLADVPKIIARPGGRIGTLQLRREGFGTRVFKVAYEARQLKIELLPDRGRFDPDALHRRVVLPAFEPGSTDFWMPCGHSSFDGPVGHDATQVLTAIGERRAALRKPARDPRGERQAETRIVPITPELVDARAEQDV